MIEAWINECQENHTQCWQHTDPVLPTRVIDVGDIVTGKEPSLVHPQGRFGRYLALSHRWGDPQSQVAKSITTKQNIAQHCQGIPLANLPATFRDTVDIARRLQIPYVWIDSLCIIQDDLKDWNSESAKMGDVYENAYATLFAERAENCGDGLAPTTKDLDASRDRIQMFRYHDDRQGTDHEIFISSKLSVYPNSLEAAFCLFSHTSSQLQNRGWILQEEILSRRKICFSATELHWQCNHLSRCECGMKAMHFFGDDRTDDFTTRSLYEIRPSGEVSKRRLSTRQGLIRVEMPTDKDKSWRKLVTAFTRRTLTFKEDRLAALAGIASHMYKTMGNADAKPPSLQPAASQLAGSSGPTSDGTLKNQYLSGIWLQYAATQLLWRSSRAREALPCHRQRPGFAPTFSWASLTGSVEFLIMMTHRDTQVLITVISGGRGALPHLPSAGDWLRVQSKALRITVFKREVSITSSENDLRERILNGDYSYQLKDGGTCYNAGFRLQTPDGVSLPSQNVQWIRLDTPEDWEYFSGNDTHTFLFLVTHASSQTSAGGMLIPNAFGLVLREVAQGYYERVCFVDEMDFGCKWDRIKEYSFDADVILV